MLTKLQQLLHRVQRHWQHNAATLLPLLNDVELQQLQKFVRSHLHSPLTAQRDVQQLLLGERLSAFTGSGYEFAENRLFQAGDDARFINWRIYARSGQLYRKVFHEERRPQLWLVVDRRGPMRFGTQSRLKVTAAVRQALVHLYQAQQQQIAVGAVLLDNPPQWYEAKTSISAQQNLIQALNRPCPPQDHDSEYISMDKVVRQLQSRLLPGSIVIFLSDFHDLEQSHLAHLHHLSQQHTLLATQVLDDIELRLPEKGRFRIATSQDTSILLNCDDTDTKHVVEQQLQKRQQHVQQWLTGAGIAFQLLQTSDEPFQLETEPHHAVA